MKSDSVSRTEYTAPTELGISVGLYSTKISPLTGLRSARREKAKKLTFSVDDRAAKG
jgi:hypothetical protein